MTIEPFVVELLPGAALAPDIDAAAGAGLAQIVSTLLTRAGLADPASPVQGRIWISDRWHAAIRLGEEHHGAEATFDEGHHLLFRLAEHVARWQGRELPPRVIHAFEDLRTVSPAALLTYATACAAPETAARAWVRAFELDPGFVAPRTALAQRALARGDSPEAAVSLLQGISVNDPLVAAELGLALWARGLPAPALPLLQSAVHNNPDEAIAAAALAALLARTLPEGEAGHAALDEALLLATQATQRAADDYRCWAALADVYRVRGDFEQAGFYYGFALRLEPDAASVLQDAAANWVMARQPQRALPLLEHALTLAPESAELYGNLAFARHALGDGAAALDAARRAAELGPTDARFRILHGDLAHEAGRRDEALAAWARAAEIEPGMTINPDGGNIGLPEATPA
jgi:tetratricopeptide (TPR) repeat protein